MKWFKIIGLLVFSCTILQAETLSLNACIEQAFQNNPDLINSNYSLKNTKISVRQAWSSLYPGVSANASTSNSGPLVSEYDSEWSWSMGGSVSQTFYRPGMYSNIDLAKKRVKSTEFSNQSLKDQIRTTVARYYYQILTSDTLIGVYKANIRLSEEQIRKMKQMVDLGMKRESDLLKSEVQRGTFEAQLVNEEASLISSKRALNVLMGRDPDTPLTLIQIPVETVDIPDFETARSLMIEQNPSLRQLKSQIDIQKLSLRVAKEAYLPSVSGSYSYSRSSGSFGGNVMESDQVSLHLSLELFSGFSRNLSIQSQKVGLDQARLDLEATLRDQDEALANQYQSLETQNKLITIHKTNLESSRKDLEVVIQQYAEGFSSILDLMDAQVSFLQSQNSLLRDLYSRKMIESEIKRLIGR